MDYCAAKGLPDVAIKAAMAETGAKDPGYQRDAWGRIIALNEAKYNPNVKPPAADAFGQLRGK